MHESLDLLHSGSSSGATNAYESWGRFPSVIHRTVHRLYWRTDATRFRFGKGPYLPRGLGRSYGDSCLNAGGELLDMRCMDHVLDLNTNEGTITCEAGLSLAAMLDIVVPVGLFVPVTPGTKFVTVGGAIANDVHGKNHHQAGTFGCHVSWFDLVRSDGRVYRCSPTDNAELFAATIGGLGLTGVILVAKIRLRKIHSALIDSEILPFQSLDEFACITAESDATYEYTAAWVDSISSTIRGIFFRGNHAPAERVDPHPKQRGSFSVPFALPNFTLNSWTVRTFNTLYFNVKRFGSRRSAQHYDQFLYPLDGIGRWNLIYGKRGCLQFQCLVPDSELKTIEATLGVISRAGAASFLTVLKKFGAVNSPGVLSFPRPGWTLTLDFPFRGRETLDLLASLDDLILRSGGRLYPAKDARMSRTAFVGSFPNYGDFLPFIDPAFSSSLWRRIMDDERI
jgi:FAD/FMN-containing dehydrogenase